jgi:hypothetical protein
MDYLTLIQNRLLKQPIIESLQSQPANDPVRASLDYLLHVADLVGFARCPHRWVTGQTEPPAKGYTWSQLVRFLFLQPELRPQIVARRPELYRDTVLQCPLCKSRSTAKHCNKCQVDRKPITIDRPWNSSAETCKEWVAQQGQLGRVAVTPSDWDSAVLAVEALRADPDVAALVEGSDLGQRMLAQWISPATKTAIHLTTRLDIAPREGHSLDHCIGLVSIVKDAGHSKHSATTHYRYLHMHAALALEMANYHLDHDRREVLQILVEDAPPYQIARRRLEPELLDRGRALLVETLNALATCRESTIYPAFDESQPGSLGGWSAVTHDPQIQDANAKFDARFGIGQVSGQAAGKETARSRNK